MIADIIIIGIIAICVILGYIKGLIGVAVKILGFIAALFIALILYTPVSNYIINNTDIVSNLQETIERKIYTEDSEEAKNIIEEQDLIKSMEEQVQNYTEEMKSEGAKYIAKGIAISVVRVRNLDRTIYNCKNTNAICKNIC